MLMQVSMPPCLTIWDCDYLRASSLAGQFRPNKTSQTPVLPLFELSYLDHPQFALWQVPELDLLDSHSFSSTPIKSFVDGTKSSLA